MGETSLLIFSGAILLQPEFFVCHETIFTATLVRPGQAWQARSLLPARSLPTTSRLRSLALHQHQTTVCQPGGLSLFPFPAVTLPFFADLENTGKLSENYRKL